VLRAYGWQGRIAWGEGVVDGRRITEAPFLLGEIRGPLDILLAAERVLLNFLQRLSGVATLTRRFVDAVAYTRAKIFDTRKTTPGWRKLEKYAVALGGGNNHRVGLFDAVLFKDNHLVGVEPRRLPGYLFHVLNELSARNARPTFVEAEARTLEEVEALLSVVGVDLILLDNFSVDQLRQAVELRDRLAPGGKVLLEASGGITLTNVRAVAESGVERISVGALTHSAPALDLALKRIAPAPPAPSPPTDR
jgi:nicotinate-nucleotide pyrophosphorylase (carboxylating)